MADFSNRLMIADPGAQTIRQNDLMLPDVWRTNVQGVGDWIAQQRAISAQRGLWNDATGLPTQAGVVDATGQVAQGILMGSTAPRPVVSIHPNGTIMADGVGVGRVRFEHGDQMTRIGDIEINPSFRNQGIGSSAIQQIQQEAAARGNPVVLSTDAFRGKEAQADQRRLYERLGFTPNRGPNAVSERIGKSRITEELVWRAPDSQ